MQEPAVTVRNLHKSYGSIEAVRGVDLTVQQGEILSLVGPNGAGKTTTLEVLEGHRRADSGEVRVLGFDPSQNEAAFKQRIGIVLQSTSIPLYLRVEEAIDMYRGYYPRPRALDEILDLVGLQDSRRKLVRRLSGGQQRRLDVGLGIAGDPDLLFLDEPTTGFDPAARRGAWTMIKDLRALGKTIILTTHYMDEAQALADRVAMMFDGHIVAEGTPDALRQEYSDTRISFRDVPPPVPLPQLTNATVQRANGRIEALTTHPTSVLHRLTEWAIEQGFELEDLIVAPMSLEEVYLRLHQGGAEGAA